MSKATANKRFFDASYDGTMYRHTYRLDPRLLIGGIMIALISPPLLWLTWPAPTTWIVPVLSAVLIGIAFLSRRRFTASPREFSLSWSFGPLGWATRLAAGEVEPFVSRGRRDTYRVLLRGGRTTLDPWIEAGDRAEADAWASFLRDVSGGIPARLPDDAAASTSLGVENKG
jgi:hypothetical protein